MNKKTKSLIFATMPAVILISASSKIITNNKKTRKTLSMLQNRTIESETIKNRILQNKYQYINPEYIWKRNMINPWTERYIDKNKNNEKFIRKPFFDWINDNEDPKWEFPIKIKQTRENIFLMLKIKNFNPIKMDVHIENKKENDPIKIKTFKDRIFIYNYQSKSEGITIRITTKDGYSFTKEKNIKINKFIHIQNDLLINKTKNKQNKIILYISEGNLLEMQNKAQIEELKLKNKDWKYEPNVFLNKDNLITFKGNVNFKLKSWKYQGNIDGYSYYSLEIPNVNKKEKKWKSIFKFKKKNQTIDKNELKNNIKLSIISKPSKVQINKKTFEISKNIAMDKAHKISNHINRINNKIIRVSKIKSLFYKKIKMIALSINDKINSLNLNDLKYIYKSFLILYNNSKKINLIDSKTLNKVSRRIKKIKFLYNEFLEFFNKYQKINKSFWTNQLDKGILELSQDKSLLFEQKWEIQKIINRNRIYEIETKEDYSLIFEKLIKDLRKKIKVMEDEKNEEFKDHKTKKLNIFLSENIELLKNSILKRLSDIQKKIFNFFINKEAIERLKNEFLRGDLDSLLEKHIFGKNSKWTQILKEKIKEIDDRLKKNFISPLEQSDKFIFDPEQFKIKYLKVEDKEKIINNLINLAKKEGRNYDKKTVTTIFTKILNNVMLNIEETKEFKALTKNFWYFLTMKKKSENITNPLLKKVYENIKFVNMGNDRGYNLFYDSNISENISLELDLETSPYLSGYVKPQNINGNGNSQNSFAAFILRAKNGYKFRVEKNNGTGFEFKEAIKIFKFVEDEKDQEKPNSFENARDYYFNNLEKIYKKYINSEKFLKNPKLIENIKTDERGVKFKSRIVKLKNQKGKRMFLNFITIEKDGVLDKKNNHLIKTSYSFLLNAEHLKKQENKSKYFWGYSNLPKSFKNEGEIKKSIDQLIKRKEFMKTEYFDPETMEEWKHRDWNNITFDYDKNPKSLINFIVMISKEYGSIISEINKNSINVWNDIIDETQTGVQEVQDAFESLGKAINENVMPVLQYLLDPGRGIQKIISLNSNIEMERLDEIFKLNKNSDEDIIEGIIPNNILSLGTNIAILPLTILFDATIAKLPKILNIPKKILNRTISGNRIRKKINKLIFSKNIPMIQLNKMGIYEINTIDRNLLEPILENESSFIEKINEEVDHKKYVDKLFEENKDDLEKLGAVGGAEVPEVFENQVKKNKKIPKLGLKGGSGTRQKQLSYPIMNAEQKVEYLKNKFMNDNKIYSLMLTNFEEYESFINKKMDIIKKALNNPDEFIKNKNREIYELLIDNTREEEYYKNLYKECDAENIIYKKINQILIEKENYIDKNIVDFLEINSRYTKEVLCYIKYHITTSEKMLKAWRFAVSLTKKSDLIQYFNSEKLFKIFKILHMLSLDRTADFNVLNGIKTWINKTRGDFLYSIENIENLKEIIKEQLGHAQAKQLKDALSELFYLDHEHFNLAESDDKVFSGSRKRKRKTYLDESIKKYFKETAKEIKIRMEKQKLEKLKLMEKNLEEAKAKKRKISSKKIINAKKSHELPKIPRKKAETAPYKPELKEKTKKNTPILESLLINKDNPEKIENNALDYQIDSSKSSENIAQNTPQKPVSRLRKLLMGNQERLQVNNSEIKESVELPLPESVKKPTKEVNIDNTPISFEEFLEKRFNTEDPNNDLQQFDAGIALEEKSDSNTEKMSELNQYDLSFLESWFLDEKNDFNNEYDEQELNPTDLSSDESENEENDFDHINFDESFLDQVVNEVDYIENDFNVDDDIFNNVDLVDDNDQNTEDIYQNNQNHETSSQIDNENELPSTSEELKSDAQSSNNIIERAWSLSNLDETDIENNLNIDFDDIENYLQNTRKEYYEDSGPKKTKLEETVQNQNSLTSENIEKIENLKIPIQNLQISNKKIKYWNELIKNTENEYLQKDWKLKNLSEIEIFIDALSNSEITNDGIVIFKEHIQKNIENFNKFMENILRIQQLIRENNDVDVKIDWTLMNLNKWISEINQENAL